MIQDHAFSILKHNLNQVSLKYPIEVMIKFAKSMLSALNSSCYSKSEVYFMLPVLTFFVYAAIYQ